MPLSVFEHRTAEPGLPKCNDYSSIFSLQLRRYFSPTYSPVLWFRMSSDRFSSTKRGPGGGGGGQHSVWRHNNIQSNLGWRLWCTQCGYKHNPCRFKCPTSLKTMKFQTAAGRPDLMQEASDSPITKLAVIIHTWPQTHWHPIHRHSNTFWKHHHLHKVTPILHSYVTLYKYMRRHV